ncbi:hypothetical protein CRUP_035578 [Coryphaenoides rupestris]|nr:hypothetical protein CRUP_035578 [Coryphaenoides rupestris]
MDQISDLRVRSKVIQATHGCHTAFLAMALRVRTLLESVTFRPYSGAESEAPMVTKLFLRLMTGSPSNAEQSHPLVSSRWKPRDTRVSRAASGSWTMTPSTRPSAPWLFISWMSLLITSTSCSEYRKSPPRGRIITTVCSFHQPPRSAFTADSTESTHTSIKKPSAILL